MEDEVGVDMAVGKGQTKVEIFKIPTEGGVFLTNNPETGRPGQGVSPDEKAHDELMQRCENAGLRLARGYGCKLSWYQRDQALATPTTAVNDVPALELVATRWFDETMDQFRYRSMRERFFAEEAAKGQQT